MKTKYEHKKRRVWVSGLHRYKPQQEQTFLLLPADLRMIYQTKFDYIKRVFIEGSPIVEVKGNYGRLSNSYKYNLKPQRIKYTK